MKKVYIRVGRWTVTAAWNDKARAPGFHVAPRKARQKELPPRSITAGGCAFYMGGPLAWYYELTGERIFLDKLYELAGELTLARRARRALGNWSYVLYLARGGHIPARGTVRLP